MSIYSRWWRRLRYRKGLLAAARQRGDKATIRRRERQVASARRVLARHRPKPLRERALAVALSKVGVMERGGNNRGREVEEFIRANGGVPGEPWCGDFVAYCYLRAGAKSVTRAWASVRQLSLLLTRVRSPRPGHVVIYDFDHTGMFERWVDRKAGTFLAIEGNTGRTGAVSDSQTGGDGVRVKQRNVSQVASFRRVLR